MHGTGFANPKTLERRLGKYRLFLLLPLCCAGLALLLPACTTNGPFTVLGYSTASNYDCNIHTVRVPIFENRTFRQGLEFQLTQAVVDDINKVTPFRVVGADQSADTELRGTITAATKGILNLNQLGETREAETAIVVELTWIDLRTGEIISRPARRPGAAEPTERIVIPGLSNGVPGVIAPNVITPAQAPISPQIAVGEGPAGPPAPPPLLAPGATPPKPPVITIRATASYIPELGQSTTTGFQAAINKMAIQIVSAMEKPW